MATSPDSVSYPNIGHGLLAAYAGSVEMPATGTTQATAAQTTTYQTFVTSGSGGLLLNAGFVEQVISNRLASTVTIYPPVGAQIEAFSVNTPVTIAANSDARYRRSELNSSKWYAGV